LRSIQDEVSGANFIFYSSNATTTDLKLLQLDYSAGSVFNEDGVSYQHVRMESDTDTHAFYLNAVNGYIGMGAGASPAQPLTIGASSGANLNYYSGTTNVISSASGIKVSKAIANDAAAGSGLNLSNTSSTDGTMSPMLHFSALSASTTYSTTYAGIWGRKRSNGTDTNWNSGSIEFGTAHSAGINKRMELDYQGALTTTPLGGGNAVFNEDGADADFRVESDSKSNMLFVDGSLDFVGIETSTRINSSATAGVLTTAGGICIETQVSGGNGYYGLWLHNNAGTQTGYIYNNGSSTSYNTSSDVRLKQNIFDAEDAGALIDNIQVRSFDWKETGEHQRYGMVAQELQTVVPEAVHQPKDADVMMGVDYSTLVPMLIKEIQSLRARVAQLENT